jgi:lipopolysaccharide transport system permease protein
MSDYEQHKPLKVISPDPLGLGEYLKELKKYSSLILVFAVQEIKANYAQTYFGVLWGIIRPLVTLFIFTLIFKYFLHVSTDSPYYLFAFCGIIAWNFFFQISMNASTAVLVNQNLIRKMYFPKIILPLAKVIVSGVDFALSLLLVFLLILFEGNLLGPQLVMLPLFIVLNVFCGLAIAFWMNTLNIKNRDLNQIVPSIIGFAIWITPVFYPANLVPSNLQVLLYANPMAGVIKGYRYAFLGEAFPEWPYWIAIILMVFVAIAGATYFAKTEDKMVDYV